MYKRQVACTALGIVIEGLAYKPLRQAPSLAVLITAIGVSYFLQNSALLIWGSAPKSYPSVITLGSINLMDGQLVISGGTIVTVLAKDVYKRQGWKWSIWNPPTARRGYF